MKRFCKAFLCAILILAMTVPPVQVFAAEQVEIVCENVVGTPGEQITVTVSVVNNPGFCYLEMTPVFSQELSLVSAVNGELFSEFEMDKQCIWSADENVTKTGLLMTFTFEIAENAPLADYSVGFVVRTCGNLNEEHVSATVLGGIVVVQEANSFIAEVSFDLSSSINANFYVELASAHQGAKMRFTMNGATTVVEGSESARNGLWLYCFEGISPQCMGDTIRAELVFGEVVLDVLQDYSVRSYCDLLCASSAEELGITEARYQAAKTMVADLLEYGAMSQVYRNYKTDALVNASVEGKSTFVELEAALWDKELGATSKAGTELVGANVWFDNEIQLYFKFTAPAISDTDFSVKVTDTDTGVSREYTLSDFEVISGEDALYGVLSEPVPVYHFGHYFTVTLNSITYDRRGNKVETVLQRLDYYGVNAYVFSKQNNRDGNGQLTAMAMLVRAAYCYGEAALAYEQTL